MTWDRDDKIGYGSPPRYTRFRKGKSGNPNGRPRKTAVTDVPPATDHDDTLRELNDRKTLVKLGGKAQKMSAFKAVAMKQQSDALAGSVTAQREILRTKEKLDERDALRAAAAAEQKRVKAIEDREMKLRLYHDLVSQHAKQTEIYRLAKEAGQDPEPRYPHPDDFVFDHVKKKATITGPWNEADEHFYRRLAKKRDYHLIDYVILDRQRPRGSQFQRNLASFEMSGVDILLPKRMQLQGESLLFMLDILFRLPMADLRAWRGELGFWLKLNPAPEPSKKGRRETYKIANTIMKPYLKASGFRSIAQLERHCEEETERAKARNE